MTEQRYLNVLTAKDIALQRNVMIKKNFIRKTMQLPQSWIVCTTFSRVSKILTRQIRFFKAIALIAVLILGTLSLMPNTAWAANNEVMIGSKQGELVFEPSTVKIKLGDTVTWVNNITADSPCNVVFDSLKFNESPTIPGEQPELKEHLLESFSHKSLIKNSQETFKKEFNVFPGVYSYSCTPHKSVGMVGKVIVQGD